MSCVTPIKAGPTSCVEYVFQVTVAVNSAHNTVIREVWENLEGKLSRRCGPALLERSDGGAPLWEEWWVDGVKHRDDGGPAVIDYDEEERGQICRLEWWVDGQRHRIDAPARIWFDPSTKEVIDAEWWIGGHLVDREKIMRSDLG